jgi:tripartite-type tricarboxylate transporter receptor subunit TctC
MSTHASNPRNQVRRGQPLFLGRRSFLLRTPAAALAPWLARAAAAQGEPPRYPSRTVRVIAPQAPGGPSDTIARLVAQHFSERWKESVIVENLGGAAGTIAGRMVARSPADGYTLLVGSNAALASAAILTEGAGYDPVRDWAPIGRIVRVGYVLALRSSLGVSNVAELVALARQRAEPLTIATVGAGSNASRSVAQLSKAAGIPLLDVPYKGGAPGLQAVLAGVVDGTFCDLALALPHVTSGALRVPANVGRTRLTALPDVPTFAESGYPSLASEPWYGIVAPAGTPAPVLAEIAAALHAMQVDPQVLGRFRTLGYEAISETPEAFAAAIATEVAQARASREAVIGRP